MDRGWMYGSRTSKEYILGVQDFLICALQHMIQKGVAAIGCPCLDCGNKITTGNVMVIRDHLLRCGFTPNYQKWHMHGEDIPTDSDAVSDGYTYSGDENRDIATSLRALQQVKFRGVSTTGDTSSDGCTSSGDVDVDVATSQPALQLVKYRGLPTGGDTPSDGPIFSGDEDCDITTSQPAPRQVKLKCRGVAQGRRGRTNEPKFLEFNDLGTPCGRWAQKYATNLGILVKNHVDINIKDWRAVPLQSKDQIWENIQSAWNIDESRRRYVLKHAGKLWNNFKNRLVSGWITKTRNEPKLKIGLQPYAIRGWGITRQQWEQFKVEHETDEFMEKSQKARKNSMQNPHPPHYMGRKGYAGMISQWKKDGAYDALFPSFDPSASSSQSPDVGDRGLNWVLARCKKDERGQYYIPDESTRLIKEKMDGYCEKATRGNWTPTVQEDLLGKVLGKPEHAGRVVGLGGIIPIRKYFGPSGKSSRERGIRKGSLPEKEVIELKERLQHLEQNMEAELKKREQQMEQELEAKIEAKFQAYIQRFEEAHGGHPAIESEECSKMPRGRMQKAQKHGTKRKRRL